MPSIDINFLLSLKDNYTKYKTFVETGTYLGETIYNMEKYFDNLYTIEISEYYYNNLNGKNDKINFILGDSSKVLNELINKINTDTIFFLDGHWSSGDTGKGDKDCPLIEEITCINDNFRHNAIIVIDDHRLFGKGPINKQCNENWEEISDDKIINILDKRITNIYFLPSSLDINDRLIIHIKNI
jgi:hypothetical protein